MMTLNDHPTVAAWRQRPTAPSEPLEATLLKTLARECGADDVGLVEIERPALDGERDDVLRSFPDTKLLLSFACRMNREPIRQPARSVANLEFHNVNDETDRVAHRIVAALERRGVRAVNPAVGFPMEPDSFPGKIWLVSHKIVAVAAGLGQMGIHRNVIHPRFGNFVLLGTVLIAAESTAYDAPIDYNPCLSCKLCVAACPVGAISPEGNFNFSACYTHNYREFMGGFGDWVEEVVESKDRRDYRRRQSLPETVSMWQSLSYGANYKAAYCMAVCPAGEDVLGPFLTDKKAFIQSVVRPLQDKTETLYVLRHSDAEAHAKKRFPHKRLKVVRSSLIPQTIRQFLSGLAVTFQPKQAKALNAIYHFTFTGAEACLATVTIRQGALQITDGHHGHADLRIQADSRIWLRFLSKEQSLLLALIRRKIRLQGPPRLLLAFGRCFPA